MARPTSMLARLSLRIPMTIALGGLAWSFASCTPSSSPSPEDSRVAGVTSGVEASALEDLAKISDPARLRVLGKLHAGRDSPEGFAAAIECYRRLLALEPGSRQDRLRLVKCLYLASRQPEARSELRIARDGFAPGSPADLDYVDALVAKSEGRHDEAARLLERVTAARPLLTTAWFQRGYTEELAKRFDDATASYREALRVMPRHRAAAYRLASVLARLDRSEEASEMRALFQSIPQEGQPDAERCDLLEIVLRPAGPPAEPPRVSLDWGELEYDVGEIPAIDSAGTGAGASKTVGGRVCLRETASGALVFERASTGRPAIVADLASDGVHDVIFAADDGVRIRSHPPTGKAVETVALSLANDARPIDLAALDLDHDGDLDIVVLVANEAGVRAVLLLSDGEGRFERRAPFGDLAGSGARAGSISAHDLDQANDLDLVIATDAGGVEVFFNQRDGSFARFAASSLGKRSLVRVEDFDGDGAPDIFAAGGEGGWVLASNADPLGSAPRQLRLREPRGESTLAWGDVFDAVVADVDNDADVDVVLACAEGVGLLRNERGVLVADGLIFRGEASRWLEAFDLDGDGRLELLHAGASGVLRIHAARRAEPAYAGLFLRPIGGRDNRGAVGVVAELFRGELYSSRMLRGPFGVHLGLGASSPEALDGLRLRWPQGIVQSMPRSTLEIEAPTRSPRPCGRVVRPRQKEGLVASCPFLFARGPQGWTFVTDVLGIAPLDEWLPPGVAPHLDPEEHVRIEGDTLVARDGELRLAITEELRETAYLDRVELIAVDHAIGTNVFADESTSQPAYSELRVFVIAEPALVGAGAVVAAGPIDARETAASRDGEYLHGYPLERSQLAGWVEPWSIDLRFTAPVRALLLTGRVAWYDSSVSYALAQSGRSWGPFSIAGYGPDGTAEQLVDSLGLPAGLDRTMVVELPRATRVGESLRLTASHRLLWDRVLAATALESHELVGASGTIKTSDGALRHQRVLLSRAELSYHGLSRSVGSLERHEQTYEYDRARPDDSWAPAVGLATRFGDVTELLEAHDDRLVVLVTGDGVELVFEDPGPPSVGERRTWFLRTSGWAKEASFHNATGESIEPLPTRAMRRYPPDPAESRGDAKYREYLDHWQTRRIRRRAP